jgi:hypothetical protein
MRILIRTSKWAIWARRIGSFALPLAVIPIFMHRSRLITSTAFEATEVVAVVTAALGLAIALGAFARLWVTGDRGWWKAALGALFSLIVLVPVGYGVSLALRYPYLTDVSTDPADPLPLVAALPRAAPEAATQQAIRVAFPNVQPRSYPLGPEQVFALALALAQARDWEIRVRRAPQGPLDEGQLNAIAMTPIGWRDEVAIRVRGVAGGSTVSMRSASLSAIHDLGANGQRIEEFLGALDNEVTLLLRDAPSAAGAAPIPAPPPPD